MCYLWPNRSGATYTFDISFLTSYLFSFSCIFNLLPHAPSFSSPSNIVRSPHAQIALSLHVIFTRFELPKSLIMTWAAKPHSVGVSKLAPDYKYILGAPGQGP